LLDINLLVQITVEKNNFNVYLFDLPVLGGSEYEERFIAYRFYYGSEDLVIVESFLLFETPDDLSGLVAEDLVMRAAFKPKNPLAPKYLSASGTAYQLLYLIFFQRF
jgi:hypothetical protein